MLVRQVGEGEGRVDVAVPRKPRAEEAHDSYGKKKKKRKRADTYGPGIKLDREDDSDRARRPRLDPHSVRKVLEATSGNTPSTSTTPCPLPKHTIAFCAPPPSVLFDDDDESPPMKHTKAEMAWKKRQEKLQQLATQAAAAAAVTMEIDEDDHEPPPSVLDEDAPTPAAQRMFAKMKKRLKRQRAEKHAAERAQLPARPDFLDNTQPEMVSFWAHDRHNSPQPEVKRARGRMVEETPELQPVPLAPLFEQRWRHDRHEELRERPSG
jgi:hypothetical protein